jgi:catalase
MQEQPRSRRLRPAEDRKFVEPPLPIGRDADRYNHREGNDDYTQAGNLYRLMPQAKKDRLHKAIAGAMEGAPREIVERQLAHFDRADPAHGKGVRAALML